MHEIGRSIRRFCRVATRRSTRIDERQAAKVLDRLAGESAPESIWARLARSVA